MCRLVYIRQLVENYKVEVTMIEPNAAMTKRLHVEVNDDGRGWMEIDPGKDISQNSTAILRLAHQVKKEYGQGAQVQVVETITITTVKSKI